MIAATAKWLPLMRLALGALDRETPNVELARGALRDALEAIGAPEPAAVVAEVNAVSIGTFARMIAASPKHVRALIKRRALGDAVIGSGRGTRIETRLAIDALRAAGADVKHADDVAEAGRAWAERRPTLCVVRGGK